MRKAEQKRWRQIEKEADAYRYLKETIGDEFKELLKNHKAKSVRPFKLKSSDRDYAVVISNGPALRQAG